VRAGNSLAIGDGGKLKRVPGRVPQDVVIPEVYSFSIDINEYGGSIILSILLTGQRSLPHNIYLFDIVSLARWTYLDSLHLAHLARSDHPQCLITSSGNLARAAVRRERSLPPL
jgi:hypothetical protein